MSALLVVIPGFMADARGAMPQVSDPGGGQIGLLRRRPEKGDADRHRSATPPSPSPREARPITALAG
ncbi:hypothetical protein [Pseudogemmobacter humi]|uniref:hypothetical protein n=1 Tax=Pseudogemmobacter humi TaxID=2483812 RepID=UPI000F538607|nr:hypothetical protein [Pseudogemmobacter humi]